MSEKKPFIKIEPIDRQNTRITYGVSVKVKQREGYFMNYLPGYDIAFVTKSKEEILPKADAMVSSFMDYYIEQLGFKSFIMELHKLGFKANQDALTLHKLLNKKMTKAKFNADDSRMPVEFLDAMDAHSQNHKELAIQ